MICCNIGNQFIAFTNTVVLTILTVLPFLMKKDTALKYLRLVAGKIAIQIDSQWKPLLPFGHLRRS